MRRKEEDCVETNLCMAESRKARMEGKEGNWKGDEEWQGVEFNFHRNQRTAPTESSSDARGYQGTSSSSNNLVARYQLGWGWCSVVLSSLEATSRNDVQTRRFRLLFLIRSSFSIPPVLTIDTQQNSDSNGLHLLSIIRWKWMFVKMSLK